MKLVATLCSQLGLSHHQLAAFTGTDRSVISKSQYGQRNIPANAMISLTRLFTLFQQLPAGYGPNDAVPGSQCEAWQLRLQECRHRAVALQRQLDRVRLQYDQACRLLAWTDALSEQQAEELTARQQRWIAERRYEAGLTLKKCSKARQRELWIQIELLQSEAELLEQVLEEEKV